MSVYPTRTVQGSINRPWIRGIVGLIAITILAFEITSIARHKLFWFDEALEVLESCTRPYSSILVSGPVGQCSPAPLYYVLQKIVVTRAGMSSTMLTTYRLVSISSAILTLIVVFFGFTRYLGATWALFALSVLTIRYEFFNYAAENRPYMLWIFLFTASLLLVSSLAYRRWETLSVVSKAALGLLLFALTLVSIAGMFQAISFLPLLSVWHQKSMSWRAWMRQPALRFQLPVAILCGGIGLYYALQGCLTYDGDQWDLLNTRNPVLVKNVFLLFYPLQLAPCGDRTNPCGVVTLSLNFLVAAAVVILLVWWRKRATLSESKKFAISVTLVSVVQIACAIFLAILVARAHYYFVPRIFLYLICLRAFLAASGAYLCMSMILDRTGERFRFLHGRAFQWLIFVGVLSFAVLSHPQRGDISQVEKIADGVKFDQNPCPPPQSKIALIDTEAPHFVASGRTYEREEYKLNFVLGLDEQLKACGWRAAAEPVVYVVPNYAKADQGIYGYEIRNVNEAGSPILGFLHQPVLPRAR